MNFDYFNRTSVLLFTFVKPKKLEKPNIINYFSPLKPVG